MKAISSWPSIIRPAGSILDHFEDAIYVNIMNHLDKRVLVMTKKLYWEQPYAKEFSAKVLSIEGNKVVLDQTLFYPRGGGVACDTGTLNDIPGDGNVKECGSHRAHPQLASKLHGREHSAG